MKKSWFPALDMHTPQLVNLLNELSFVYYSLEHGVSSALVSFDILD